MSSGSVFEAGFFCLACRAAADDGWRHLNYGALGQVGLVAMIAN